MKLLVMGGTEFVSSSVAKYFISKNYQVDIFTRGVKPISYRGVNIHHKGDRKSLDELSVLNDIAYDYIIDISAYTLDDVKFITKSINKENLKRYVFCSTGGVYIPSSVVMDENYERGENHNWLKYGLDKLEAEEYLFELNKTESFPMTIFRPTYIYGPNNNLYRESHFFDRIIENKAIPYPDSSNKTQFIHIDDLVKIIESMLNNEESIGEAYNVTNESPYSFYEIAKMFNSVCKSNVPVLPIDTNQHTIARKYFPYRDVTYLLSIEKLKKHNLHIPKYDLFEGLSQTYEWYKENKPLLTDNSMTDIDLVIKK